MEFVVVLHNRDVCLLVEVEGGDGDVYEREEEHKGRHHNTLWGVSIIGMWVCQKKAHILPGRL